MVDEGPQRDEGRKPRAAAAMDGLAMNEVPSSATQETSEVRWRAGKLWLLLLGVLAAIVLLAYGARTFLNMPPGAEAEQSLRARLQETDAWQSGTVLGVQYVSGDRIRVDLARSAVGQSSAVRPAMIEVMQILREQRPGRDLYIDGYQGSDRTVEVEYRQKGGLEMPGGGVEPDIRVRIEGEAEGGIGARVRPSGRSTPGP